MTTKDIADRANAGRAAPPTMDLQLVLRGEVIPEFMEDVGYPAWRRIVHDATVLAAENSMVLPIHLSKVFSVHIGTTYSTELLYVGNVPAKRVAFQTTTAGTPSYFDLQTGIGQTVLGGVPGWTMVFDCPMLVDTAVRVIGYIGSLTGDDYTNVFDLDTLIPRHVQPALICGLRRYIHLENYGAGDRRYLLEDEKYRMWVARLRDDQENAPSTREVRMA